MMPLRNDYVKKWKILRLIVTTGITLSNFLSFLGLFHSIEQLNSGYDSTFSIYQFIYHFLSVYFNFDSFIFPF